MYFPYLRGRQFELLALRELAEQKIIGEKIFPVIEPVKLSSTLIKTLDAYKQKNKSIAIIMNPSVGELSSVNLINEDNSESKRILSFIQESDCIKSAFHLTKSLLKNPKYNKEDCILIANKKENIDVYNELYGENEAPLFTLMRDESDFRRSIRNQHRVLLADNFVKKPRNSDYENRDEIFTRDHLYYAEDGYAGFSDYSIIGNEYSESGFAPYAVAIHIVYLNEKGELTIRHFVSDTNEDFSDTPRKLQEALEKLIQWDKEHKMNTYAMQQFHKLYDQKIYPGLGIIKKLSIMHHIETVNSFLKKTNENK